MPRGRKSLTLDEQLAKITEEIDNMEESLKKLKATKKDLEEQIKLSRLSELDDLIRQNGMSIEDIKNILNEKAGWWCPAF